jgi:hypothetical protein
MTETRPLSTSAIPQTKPTIVTADMNDVKEAQISGVKTPVIDVTPAIPSRSWWAFLGFYDVYSLPRTKEELEMKLLRVQINTSM